MSLFFSGALENDPVVYNLFFPYENYAARSENEKSSFEPLDICHELII